MLPRKTDCYTPQLKCNFLLDMMHVKAVLFDPKANKTHGQLPRVTTQGTKKFNFPACP